MKIIEEFVYQEYANWRLENEEFLDKIYNSKSTLKNSFEHILPVLEIFYEELIDNEEYGEEEDQIFKVGFSYASSNVEDLKYILENYLANDFKRLEELSKTINLYFHLVDFESEIYQIDNATEKDIEKFQDLEKEVLSFIERGENAPNYLFEKVDRESAIIFRKLNYTYRTMESLFYEGYLSLIE